MFESAEEVYELQSEKQKKNFVEGFRELIKTRNQLDTYLKFTFDDLDITEQEYDDFVGAYLNIKDSIVTEPGDEGKSILDDIDFKLDLLRTDKINVDYILELLETTNLINKGKKREEVVRMMKNTVSLRSKIKLMEKFIDTKLDNILEEELNVKEEWDTFIQEERRESICKLIDEEGLIEEIAREIIKDYQYYEKIDDDVIEESFMDKTLLFAEKDDKIERVKAKILEIFEVFDFK